MVPHPPSSKSYMGQGVTTIIESLSEGGHQAKLRGLNGGRNEPTSSPLLQGIRKNSQCSGEQGGVVHICNLALGGRGREIRSLGSALAVYQIQGQPRIHETLPSKQQTKIKARKIKINKQTKPRGAGKWLSG